MKLDDEVGEVEVHEAPSRRPRKAVAKANGKAKPIKAAKGKGKAIKATPKAAKAKRERKEPLDDFGFRVGSLKSKAAAMYAAKRGATLAEVKKALKSSQLNLLTDLESRGFKINRVKEDGDGARQITRYFLRA